MLSGCVEIELYGIRLQVYKSFDLSVPHSVVESRTTTMEAFKVRVCDELSLDPSRVRIWDYFNLRKYEEIGQSECKSLEACRLFDGNPVLIEHQCPDGSWPTLQESSPVHPRLLVATPPPEQRLNSLTLPNGYCRNATAVAIAAAAAGM